MYIYTHMYLSIHTYMVQSIYVQLILSCVSDGKESSKKPGFNAWVRKITWRRKWQPTPVFLPGEFHGQRSLEGYTVHGVAKSQT